MIAYLLYQPNTEMERPCRDLAKELERNKVDIRLIDADSIEGSHLCELYDLMSRPALVLTRLDGTVVERWQHQLPLVTDVTYLAHS
jgi:hypothetical protein